MTKSNHSLTFGDCLLKITINKGGVRWVSPGKSAHFSRTKQGKAVFQDGTVSTHNVPSEDREQQLICNKTTKVIKVNADVLKEACRTPIKKNGRIISGMVFSRTTCEELNFKGQPENPNQRLVAFCQELAGDFRGTLPMWEMEWTLEDVQTKKAIHCFFTSGHYSIQEISEVIPVFTGMILEQHAEPVHQPTATTATQLEVMDHRPQRRQELLDYWSKPRKKIQLP